MGTDGGAPQTMYREGVLMIRDRGFTLIELMIVVSILAIVASVAIPSLLSSRKAANEASTISMLRTAHTVNELYRSRFGEYAPNENDWVAAGLLPEDNGGIAGGPRGYDFTYVGGLTVWDVVAVPSDPGHTGDRSFYADETGIIRFNSSGPAGPLDAPVD
ncbi:MAG: type II secretion system protein [Planctomycetota bacterium]